MSTKARKRLNRVMRERLAEAKSSRSQERKKGRQISLFELLFAGAMSFGNLFGSHKPSRSFDE